MQKLFLISLISFLTLAAQQRPPASVIRRPPANVQQRPAQGKMVSLRDLDFEIVKLSYIQTDRALAILKTLGYGTVEFKQAKGEIRGENNFTPQFTNKANNLSAPGALPIIIKLPDTETISLVEKSTSKASSRARRPEPRSEAPGGELRP